MCNDVSVGGSASLKAIKQSAFTKIYPEIARGKYPDQIRDAPSTGEHAKLLSLCCTFELKSVCTESIMSYAARIWNELLKLCVWLCIMESICAIKVVICNAQC